MLVPVQVAWLTGTEELNRQLVAKLAAEHPELPIVTVSEFPVEGARWIAFHPKRVFAENLRAIRAALANEKAVRAALLLVPRVPFRNLRMIAILTSGRNLHVYDRNLNARPWPMQVPRFAKAWLEWHLRPQSPVNRWLRRISRPAEALVPLYAKLAPVTASMRRQTVVTPASYMPLPLPSGVVVVIPSRDGLHLLKECLPPLMSQAPAGVIVVDNGSHDGTAQWLAAEHPSVEVVCVAEPLSFARAINLGTTRVHFNRMLLLNNDMLIEPDFLQQLNAPFDSNPDLFCATAQILFPPGVRRQETGKAVLREPLSETEFPVRCDLPLPGEDGTWVLYGSGGCSLFDTARFIALGGLNEALEPAYVEDLDLGFRAWQRGWPSVFRAKARVEHRHRSTTSRYWSEQQLSDMVQLNYLRFLMTAVVDKTLFRSLWNHAIRRLHLAGSRDVLRAAVTMPLRLRSPGFTLVDESQFLALTNGDAAVFPGRSRTGRPVVIIASAYLPFPLSHGGAVRIFNLMAQAAHDFDLVLVGFVDEWEAPAAELLALASEVVVVRRTGSHYRVSDTLPDTVEEFASATFAAALQQTISKWSARIVQLEWTQMAQYASHCASAKTVLVEHDITYDLYCQMAMQDPKNTELNTQLERWRAFETNSWASVDRVVTMSKKDRQTVGLATACAIPNGVDTVRYQPSSEAHGNNTLLFIGSFAHHPNRLAVEWFLAEVWPLLEPLNPTLHIIAGTNHERWNIAANIPGVSIEGFVADVRPAYREAAVVIAPLIASAGTNIKILEAMAMGKAIVSTPAGVNGLEVDGVEVAESAHDFAAALTRLLNDVELRQRLGIAARQRVEQKYSWKNIGQLQSELYRELMDGSPH